MYIEHLTTFINLAETLNFSKTAINMHLSQSSVSQAIASIEKQLGITLFYRSHKSVSLTPAGLDFYESLKPWMNGYYKAVQHAQQVENRTKTNLTIGYSGTPYENAVIPNIVKEFSKSHSNIKIFFENYSHQELIDHLSHGTCDLIFTMPDIIAGSDNLDYHNLVVGYYCVIAPQNYHFTCGTRALIEDLDNQSVIFLDHRWCPPSQGSLQQVISRNCHNLNLSYVNNIETAHAMVKAGLGLGIWANFVSDPRDADLKSIPISTKIIPEYGVALLKNSHNEAAKSFIRWLEKNELPG